MGVSTNFMDAMKRLDDIGKELVRIRSARVYEALRGSSVHEVRIESTLTHKLTGIHILLASGDSVTITSVGIGEMRIGDDEHDLRVRDLEAEWKLLNTKWHIYP
jgi:hypothetical protein